VRSDQRHWPDPAGRPALTEFWRSPLRTRNLVTDQRSVAVNPPLARFRRLGPTRGWLSFIIPTDPGAELTWRLRTIQSLSVAGLTPPDDGDPITVGGHPCARRAARHRQQRPVRAAELGPGRPNRTGLRPDRRAPTPTPKAPPGPTSPGVAVPREVARVSSNGARRSTSGEGGPRARGSLQARAANIASAYDCQSSIVGVRFIAPAEFSCPHGLRRPECSAGASARPIRCRRGSRLSRDDRHVCAPPQHVPSQRRLPRSSPAHAQSESVPEQVTPIGSTIFHATPAAHQHSPTLRGWTPARMWHRPARVADGTG